MSTTRYAYATFFRGYREPIAISLNHEQFYIANACILWKYAMS
ncbi:MAG: hypothetical protein V7L04_23470 [Nostoc sp.]